MNEDTTQRAPQTFVDAVRFDERGLVVAIAQDALSGEVRMLAYADRAALEKTLETREAHFFSRSRKRLWKKGEESGHVLAVREVRLDCDGDAVLYLVDPRGPSCHTGAPGCFYRLALEDESVSETPAFRSVERGRATVLLERLEAVIDARRAATAERSYTKSLLEAGAPRIGAKLREEADEFARAIDRETDERVISEAADVLYHLLVGLASRSISFRAVLVELARRFGVGGHDEKAARGST